MAPKKRASTAAPAAAPARNGKKARRQAAESMSDAGVGIAAGGVAYFARNAGAEEVQTTAFANVLQELANAFEQTGRAMPAIRKYL